MFPEARIARRNITIFAPGAPGSYVQGARWNGRPVDRPWLPEEFVRRGGVLRVDPSGER